VTVVALGIASFILFLSFYAHFTSLAHGIGVVQATSNIFQFLQIYGLFLLAGVIFLSSLGFLLQPVDDAEVEEPAEPPAPPAATSLEAGHASAGISSDMLLGACLLLFGVAGVWFHEQVLVLLAIVAAATLFVAYRVLLTEDPNRCDLFALGAIVLACGVLAFPEVFYLRDAFDGSSMSRMNTVFKFYYQGWTLLGLAAAYGTYRGWGIIGRLFDRRLAYAALALIAVGTTGGLVYTIEAPTSAAQGVADQSLNGLAQLRADHPGDYHAILWLHAHVHGNPVELEMTGKSYDETSARIATFTGLPTVMGWAEHEGQWRGADPEITARVNDVTTIYTTTSTATAERLLRKYGVRYLVVGESEHAVPHVTPGSLTKFGSFMRLAYRYGDTMVYTW
jgi:uncharacterized membrane protein